GPLGHPGLSESGGDFGMQFDVELFEHVLLSGEELVERTAGDAGFLAQRLHTGPAEAIGSVQLEGRFEQTCPPGRIAFCAQRAVPTVRGRIERRYGIHHFIIVKILDFNAIQAGMSYTIRPSSRAPAFTAAIVPDPSLRNVCIIGAGSWGIAAAKTLYTSAIPFDCCEKGSEIGGTWLFDNPNGTSACYETLQINTSCPRMAFSDFPMPEHYPHYASHDQVFAYFRDYVEHFGFGHTITFNTEATDVRPGR